MGANCSAPLYECREKHNMLEAICLHSSNLSPYCSASDLHEIQHRVKVLGFALVPNFFEQDILHACNHIAAQVEAASEAIAVTPWNACWRGDGRVSLKHYLQAHFSLPGFQKILGHKALHNVLRHCISNGDYIIPEGTGDVVFGHTHSFQYLHNDDSRNLPLGDHWPGNMYPPESPSILAAVIITGKGFTKENGATRLMPWRALNWLGEGIEDASTIHERLSNRLLLPTEEHFAIFAQALAPPGSLMIRDIRAAHGGCPNYTGQSRCMMGLLAWHRAYWNSHWSKRVESEGVVWDAPLCARSLPEDVCKSLPDDVRPHCDYLWNGISETTNVCQFTLQDQPAYASN